MKSPIYHFRYELYHNSDRVYLSDCVTALNSEEYNDIYLTLRVIYTGGAAGREQPSLCTVSSCREAQNQSVAARAPPRRDRWLKQRSGPGFPSLSRI